MFPTETLYPGGYTPGYTGSLCRRISSSVSALQAGVILPHSSRVNRRFRCPDRDIFDINQGGGGDAGAGFMDHPQGTGSGRDDGVAHALMMREHGDAPGLSGPALPDSRQGWNTIHPLDGLFRQATHGRRAGCRDSTFGITCIPRRCLKSGISTGRGVLNVSGIPTSA